MEEDRHLLVHAALARQCLALRAGKERKRTVDGVAFGGGEHPAQDKVAAEQARRPELLLRRGEDSQRGDEPDHPVHAGPCIERDQLFKRVLQAVAAARAWPGADRFDFQADAELPFQHLARALDLLLEAHRPARSLLLVVGIGVGADAELTQRHIRSRSRRLHLRRAQRLRIGPLLMLRRGKRRKP
jgi:hypothetical protein